MKSILIIILIIALIGDKLNKNQYRQNKQTPLKDPTYYNEEKKQDFEEIDKEIETTKYIKSAYTQKWMFTMNEKPAYYKLKEIANKQNMIVFAKVRLFDLVEPRKGHQKYKSNLYRIQAKHVDFVITKNNLVATHIIELDDGSHDTPDRKERDKFVDTVLTSCGYKVLRTREIQEEEISKFLS